MQAGAHTAASYLKEAAAQRTRSHRRKSITSGSTSNGLSGCRTSRSLLFSPDRKESVRVRHSVISEGALPKAARRERRARRVYAKCVEACQRCPRASRYREFPRSLYPDRLCIDCVAEAAQSQDHQASDRLGNRHSLSSDTVTLKDKPKDGAVVDPSLKSSRIDDLFGVGVSQRGATPLRVSAVKPGLIGRRKGFANRKRLEPVIERYLRDCFDRREVAVAALLGGERTYVSDLFRTTFGKSLSALFRERQLAHAARLLALTKLLVDEVARASGFGDRSAFFRRFREAYGVTPSEYRRQKNQQNATLRAAKTSLPSRLHRSIRTYRRNGARMGDEANGPA